MAPCDPSAPEQLFTFSAADKMIRGSDGNCLTYGGYYEANFHGAQCVGWTAPGIGSQLWAPTGPAGNLTLVVVDNTEKVADVIDCDVSGAPGTVQVCTFGGADCYSSAPGPAGCGTSGQFWRFDASGAPSTIASSVGGFSHCVASVAMPPPPIVLQVWAKPLAGGDVALLAFNRDTRPVLANLTTAMAGWPADASAKLYDVWAHADAGTVTGAWSVEVAPHDVYMVRATRQ
jgi:hypothetical protein